MLQKILNREVCAKCRICCVFDESDAWEIPVFTDEACRRILAAKPDTEFVPRDGGYALRVGGFDERGLFTCPALTDNGCMLGDDKPFDCSIWPFRIMEVGGRRAVTIALLCGELCSRPLSELVGFLREGLAERIFAYADANPAIVKPYSDGYAVLLFEE